MSESQTADNHISEVGTAQTASGNQTEAVGEQTVASSGNQTEFDAEMNAMWGLPAEEGEEQPGRYDDESGEEAPEVEEEDQEEASSEDADLPEDQEEAQAEEPGLTLNFMGTNLDVSLDEAKTLAQKGLNADRLTAKYDRLKPLESMLEPIETMAYMYGVPVEAIVKDMAAMNGIRQGEIQRLASEGMTEEAAAEVFQSKYEAARAKRGQETATKARQGLSRIQKEEIYAFQKLRPDVDRKIKDGMKIPDDVVQNWRNGVPLTESWLLHEVEEAKGDGKALKEEIKTLKKERDQLKKDLKNLQKNTENRAKAPSSKRGTGGGSGHENPFRGWDQF